MKTILTLIRMETVRMGIETTDIRKTGNECRVQVANIRGVFRERELVERIKAEYGIDAYVAF